MGVGRAAPRRAGNGANGGADCSGRERGGREGLLESDPAQAVEGVQAYREWLQTLHDETIASLHGVHFDIDEKVRRIEVMIPPAGGALIPYYTGPSEDFSRPGRTWWPVDGLTRFPKWGDVSIAYHEGVPGHHLQVGGVRALGDELSRFQRMLTFISGHGEGWALYAERLMGELGYLEEPGLLSRDAERAGAALRASDHRHRRPPRAADTVRARRFTRGRSGTTT